MDNSVEGPPGHWQLELAAYCQSCKLPPPVFQIVSDRRGGRTAWSSRVTAGGKEVYARFWYDGRNISNAKEDAAEVALNTLKTPGSSAPAQGAGVAYGRGMRQ